MIHQFRDKKQIAKRKRIIQTAIGFGIFLLLSILGLWTASGGLMTYIGRYIWKTELIITDKLHNATSIIRTKASVFNENDNLKKENSDLRISMIDYQILKSENDQLKELLGRPPQKENFILATILTKPNRSPYDTIIIDIGSDQGLEVGNEVYANGDIPIGKVSKVYAKASLVVLYSNPGQVTNAILDGTNTNVELVGRGGGNFEMEIPLDLTSEKGTNVVLPGITPHIIAIIEEVLSMPTDPVKKIILRSPVNIQSLKWVEVKRY